MPIVSNTSPILNLAIIGQLALAQRQFETVWISPAVLEELQLDAGRPGSSELSVALRAGWLRLAERPEQQIVALLRRELDQGEAEAIALALQWHAEYVLLDERNGRRIARSQGLKVTGVVGILIRAKQQGELPSLGAALVKLRLKAGFHLGAGVIGDALRAVGEEVIQEDSI